MNIELEISKGSDFEVFFYLGRGLPIEQTTGGTPIVVTIPNHGASNGQTAILGEHSQKAANGVWIIQNKATHTFELTGSVGIEGGVDGVCQFCEDSTGKTLACEVRYVSGSEIVMNPTVEFSQITISKIKLFFAAEDTKEISVSRSVFDIFTVDNSGRPIVRVSGTIKWIPTVTQIDG